MPALPVRMNTFLMTKRTPELAFIETMLKQINDDAQRFEQDYIDPALLDVYLGPRTGESGDLNLDSSTFDQSEF